MKNINLYTLLFLSLITVTLSRAQNPEFTLYGLTIQGGQYQDGNIFQWPIGGGLFQSDHDFGNNGDGSQPWGSLLLAKNGLTYGMTKSGGSGLGIIFSFNTTNDSEKILHKFTGSPDGATPYGSFIQAGDGLLYGMTTAGGAGNLGAIISFNPATDSETVLYSFSGVGSDGQYPYGSLIQAKDSLLYGLTQRGGAYDSGSVFSFNISTGVETKLYDLGHNGDAAYPYGALMQASDGLLYGLSSAGGASNFGTIFSYNISSGRDSVLHNFSTDTSDGRYPYGSLIQANNGLLYGMTEGGGVKYDGMIFSYNIANGAFNDVYNFGSIYQDGVRPQGTLLQASDSNLYGMTTAGGSNFNGVAFSYNLTDSSYSLFNFTGVNAYLPYYGALIEVGGPTTGINPVVVNNKVSVFPNPTSGKFTLKLADNQTAYSAEIYNVVGEKIYQAFLSGSQNTIDLSARPDGIYLIYLKSEAGISETKLLITK